MTPAARHIFLFFMSLIALLCLTLSLSKGSTSVPLDQLLFHPHSEGNSLFLQLRLPRTLTAFVVGGLLALAGALIQLLLQNPLADPYTLGVSGGATLATLTLMLMGVSESWLIGGAWLGSLLIMLLMITLAKKHRWQTGNLLLSGIALACGLSAAISFILLMTPDIALHSLLFWLSGDLNDARIPWSGLIVLGAGLVICLVLAPGFNIAGRGDLEARALGLASQRYRIALFLLSSLFTATAVTLAGCIGFIGLIVPHLTRRLTGYDHRLMLPVTVLMGGSLLTLADTGARTLFAPQQIPVGIVTALIGVPVFVWLLQK